MIFKDFKKRISYIGSHKGALYIVDENNRIFIFDESLLFVKGFKINFFDNKPYEKSVKFDENYEKIAVISGKNVGVWDINKRKNLFFKKIKKDLLSIDIDSNYVSTGGIDGKILLYSIEKKTLLGEIKHKDFITDIAIDSDNYTIYAAGYDKAVLFCNMITMNKKERYLHISDVKKLFVQNYLISADSESGFIIWKRDSFDNKESVSFYTKFCDFCVYNDFVLILGSKKTMIYDIKKDIIIKENFFEFDNGDKIEIFSKYILISDIKGKVHKFNLFEKEQEAVEYLKNENFKKLFECFDENPFLKYSHVFKKTEKYVSLLIKKALLIYGKDKDKALNILKKLSEVPQLRAKTEKIIDEYEIIEKFKFALKHKNYILAYELAKKYDFIKKSGYYELLEKIWIKTFEKAYQLAMKGKTEEASEVLAPFEGVESKLPLIKRVLKNWHIIALLKEKEANSDFKGFFDLIKEFPELKESKEYKKVMKYAEKLYKKAVEYFNNEKYDKAKKIAELLLNFDGFAEKSREIIEKIDIVFEFQNYLAEKNFKELEILTEAYTFLKHLPIYKKYLEVFSEINKKTEI